jgi:hypothetical protein
MEAENTALLKYFETRADVLHRAFELKEGRAIFRGESNNNDDANLCSDEEFIQKVAHLVDMFGKTYC